MELVERIRGSVKAQGTRRAALDEFESFQRRVRYLVELGQEKASGEDGGLMEVLEQMEAVCDLAGITVGELWRTSRGGRDGKAAG